MTNDQTTSPAHKQRPRLYSTAEAAHVILGGTDTRSYWGFEFGNFVTQLQDGLTEKIGYPLAAPWRNDIDFTADDYIELERTRSGLDFTKDPAGHMDEALAEEFVRRSDIVGVSGPIGAGKDTVVDSIIWHGFVRMSFADPLRLTGSLVYGIPLRYFNDRELKEIPLPNSPMSPRRVLQIIGTDVVREIHKTIWIKRTLLRMASAMHDLGGFSKNVPQRISAANGIRVAIADVRFQNEADLVRDMGGRIVKVHRPDLDRDKLAKNGAGHASEGAISDAPSDIRLLNQGPMEAFQATACETILRALAQPGAEAEARVAPRRKP